MSSGVHIDYASAVFSAVGDTIKKIALLVTVPVVGQFVGYNCYEAPGVMANLGAGGLSGLSLSSFTGGASFASMLGYWIVSLMLSFTHLPTLLYPLVLLYAWAKLWLAEEEWWRAAAFILIVQPLDSWYVMCAEDNGMSRGDFAISAVVIGLYEAAAIGAAIWYARQLEAVDEKSYRDRLPEAEELEAR